jgi:phage portal protein BeeE
VPSLLRSIRDSRGGRILPSGRQGARSAALSIDDYSSMISTMLADWQTTSGPFQQTWRNEPVERVGATMAELGRHAYKGNGLAFSLIAVRMVSFSLVRFAYQRMRNGRPGDLFGTPSLLPLETPWPGGTTQDLLQRMLLDVDLAGNAYIVRDGPWLLRLRPDWVQILLEPVILNGGVVGTRRIAYTFHNGGIDTCPPEEVALFPANAVCHFAPVPDPDATFRGMSWMTALTREITNDRAFERHKTRFMENAATPNLSVSLAKEVSAEDFAQFREIMETEHAGTDNVGKTLYLGGGADVKVIGANFEQLQINDVQGRGETRAAAAAGVPPVIAGFSEGLSSATYSNYGLAMRRFADLTMASLWTNVAGSLATIVRPPASDSRLFYDSRDVAFLREDRKAAAEISQIGAATINQYIVSGFTPESAVAAWQAQDPTLLVHSGLVSVQLQPPGALDAAGSAPPTDDGGTPPPTGENSATPHLPTRVTVGTVGEVDRLASLYGTNGANP